MRLFNVLKIKKTMKRLLIFVSAFFLLNIISYAQKDTITNKTTKKSDRLYYGFSANYKMNFINVGNFNNRLKLYNYPELTNVMNSYGVKYCIYSSDKSFCRISSDNISLNKENANYRIKFNSYVYSAEAAINVLDKKRWFLYPILGVGFTQLNFKIIDKTNISNTFNQSISNLNGMNEIYTNTKKSFFNLNVGANIDWLISEKINNEYYIGLETGYRIQLTKFKWQTNNSNLSDAPNFNFSGFYVGVNLTFL